MVTVRLEDIDEGVPKKSLSDSKIKTLEKARARSLEVRRERASAKLEAKLNALRSVMGRDMRSDTVERVAREWIAHEDRNSQEIARLRERQIKASEELQDVLQSMRDDINRVRKAVSGQHTGSAPTRPAARSSPIPKRPGSDVGSRASSSTVT